MYSAKDFRQYAENINVTLAYGSINDANSQAIAERINCDLKSNLAEICKRTYEWDIELEYFKLAHNSKTHSLCNFLCTKH